MKNEVVENVSEIETKNSVNEAESKRDLTVREDINCIVKSAKFHEIKSKYGTRHPYIVTLFNGVTVEFTDPDNFYDLLLSMKNAGLKDFVKTKSLIEEPKINEEGEIERVYVCMLYELSDGSTIRLFPKSVLSRRTLINYYNLYKAQLENTGK